MISRIALLLALAANAAAQTYPAKTPEAIVTRLNAEIVRIINLPDVRTRILDLGGEPVGNSPQAFDTFQKAEMTRWAQVIRDSGAKMN